MRNILKFVKNSRGIIEHLVTNFRRAWVKKQAPKIGLVIVRIGAGVIPLILVYDQQYYVTAETFLATVGLTGAVLYSFVYTLSMATVARYRLRWRNVFVGNLLMTAGICGCALVLRQLPIMEYWFPTVEASHILAGALLSVRNTVFPLLTTLNLASVNLRCEFASTVLFGLGLIVLHQVLDMKYALLGSVLLQTAPHFLVARHLVKRRGQLAKPFVSIADGISGVLDAIFGSMATNGTRLMIVGTANKTPVTELAIFRIGVGLAYAATQAFFLLFGRKIMKEINGGKGNTYAIILFSMIILLSVNTAVSFWAGSAGLFNVLIVNFSVSLLCTGLILYYIRFRLFKMRRVLAFVVLCGALYAGLQSEFSNFVILWCIGSWVGAGIIFLFHYVKNRWFRRQLTFVLPGNKN